MTKEQEKRFLAPYHLKTLEFIHDLNLGFSLGGSISLIEWGVCERTVGDLDFISDSEDKVKYLFNLKGVRSDPDRYEDRENKQRLIRDSDKDYVESNISHYKLFIINSRSCIFLGDNRIKKECIINGLKFMVQHPCYAIEAKRKYIQLYNKIEQERGLLEYQEDTRQKHLNDILAYEKIFNDSPPSKLQF